MQTINQLSCRFIRSIAYLCISHIVAVTFGQTINDSKQLMEELFTTRGYNRDLRPLEDQSKILEISSLFGVTGINNFDITNRKLSISGYIYLMWTDDQLQWNASRYGGVETLSLKNDKIWVPNIDQYAEDSINVGHVSHLTLDKNGHVFWISAGTFSTTCQVDVFLYPFDKHVCEFYFFSSLYQSNLLKIVMNNERVVDLYFQNTEWSVDDDMCTSETRGDSLTSVSGFTCTLYLSRRPTFGLFHVLLPVLCLTVLTLVVFWLPVNCGERISFSVTLFLAYTLTLTGLAEEIPRNSIKMSLYSHVLVFMNIISATCVLFSVVVMRISLSASKTVPDWCKTLVRCLVRKNKIENLKLSKKQISNDNYKSCNDGNPTERVDDTDHVEQDANTVADPDGEISWFLVSQCVDTVLFATIITVMLVAGTVAVVYILNEN